MLQKTFEINAGTARPALLNVEIGNTYIALSGLQTSGEPAPQFELFNFLPADNWADTWAALPSKSTILGEPEGFNVFEQVRIIWENDWVQTIPNVFLQPELASDFATFNKGSLSANKQLMTTTQEYSFLYTVAAMRYELITRQLPGATHQHKYAAVVNKIKQLDSTFALQLLLIFYQDHFIICAVKDGRLQLINTHYFNNGTAIIYHLLNAVRQLGAELTQSCVYLSGLIDGDSALYREIYKFVPVIDVDQLAGADFLADSEQYPSHFFVPFYKYS